MYSSPRGILLTVLLALTTFAVSGCAGARLNKGAESKAMSSAEKIEHLESESRAKSKEITRLQMELMDAKRRLADAEASRPVVIRDDAYPAPAANVTASNVTVSHAAASKVASAISVPGVTVLDVQKALRSAGHDPGPLDGRLGKRTKQAILDFQRAQGLKADGVVGQKTWSALKRSV